VLQSLGRDPADAGAPADGRAMLGVLNAQQPSLLPAEQWR
jgi:hypothetical protein